MILFFFLPSYVFLLVINSDTKSQNILRFQSSNRRTLIFYLPAAPNDDDYFVLSHINTIGVQNSSFYLFIYKKVRVGILIISFGDH